MVHLRKAAMNSCCGAILSLRPIWNVIRGCVHGHDQEIRTLTSLCILRGATFSLGHAHFEPPSSNLIVSFSGQSGSSVSCDVLGNQHRDNYEYSPT